MICSRVMYTMLIHISTECESSRAYCVCNDAHALHPTIHTIYSIQYICISTQNNWFDVLSFFRKKICVSDRTVRISYGNRVCGNVTTITTAALTAPPAANNPQTREHFIHRSIDQEPNNTMLSWIPYSMAVRFECIFMPFQLSDESIFVLVFVCYAVFIVARIYVRECQCNQYTWCSWSSVCMSVCTSTVHATDQCICERIQISFSHRETHGRVSYRRLCQRFSVFSWYYTR